MKKKESAIKRFFEGVVQIYMFVMMALILIPSGFVMFVLPGFELWLYFFPPQDSNFVKTLKQVESNEYEYARTLIPGEWEVICLFRGYQSEPTEPIPQKLHEFSKVIDTFDPPSGDSIWNVVLANRQEVTYMTTKSFSNLTAVQQDFTDDIQARFQSQGFTPQECAKFSDSVFFRYDVTKSDQTPEKYVTLGEIVN